MSVGTARSSSEERLVLAARPRRSSAPAAVEARRHAATVARTGRCGSGSLPSSPAGRCGAPAAARSSSPARRSTSATPTETGRATTVSSMRPATEAQARGRRQTKSEDDADANADAPAPLSSLLLLGLRDYRRNDLPTTVRTACNAGMTAVEVDLPRTGGDRLGRERPTPSDDGAAGMPNCAAPGWRCSMLRWAPTDRARSARDPRAARRALRRPDGSRAERPPVSAVAAVTPKLALVVPAATLTRNAPPPDRKKGVAERDSEEEGIDQSRRPAPSNCHRYAKPRRIAMIAPRHRLPAVFMHSVLPPGKSPRG